MTQERGGGSDTLATLTSGSIARTLLGLSGPMIIGLFSVMAFNLTDTYFVSQLGTRELAAMTFTFPVVSVLYGIAMGMGTGTVSTIARAIGRGETANVRRVCSDSLMLSFIIVLVVATAGVLTINPLFRALGATDEILPLIHEYMVIWYPGVVFLVVPMVANAAIRASGDTRLPALIMTGAMTFNVLLDPIMIFGLFGFPRMELAGAAWATVVARACTMIASIAILHFRLRLLDYSSPKMRDVLESWRQVVSIAIPASLTNIMPSFATGFVTRLIAVYGASAVAAWGAGSRISYFVLIPVFAMCSGLVPFIGQNWGAEEFGRVRTARGYGYRIALAWGLVTAVLLHVGARSLAMLFSDSEDVVDRIVTYLWVIPIGSGMVGALLVAEETLNAIGKPIAASAQTAIHIFALYGPLAFLGSHVGGLVGLLAGIALADILGGAVSMQIVRRLCGRRGRMRGE